MMRTLAVFWYYLSWQRLLVWITAGGFVLMTAGLTVATGPLAIMLTGIGSLTAAGFSTLLGGIAFRQIVSNPRLSLVPRFREFAVIGLAVLAVFASIITLVFFRRALAVTVLPQELLSFAAVFTLISVYLLLTQWFVANQLGVLGFAFVPLVMLRILDWWEPGLRVALTSPWLMAAVAMGGWVWLFVAMRTARGPVRGVAAPLWAGGAAGTDGVSRPLPVPPIGQPKSAAGTLMRGGTDSWPARLTMLIGAPLGIPVFVLGVFTMMGMPLDAPYLPYMALTISFYGVAVTSLLLPAEWPARMRYLWLRSDGDRAALWSRLERGLLADSLVLGALAVGIALAFALTGAVDRLLLVEYVAGSVVVAVLSGYCGFWFRISGWQSLAQMTYVIGIAILTFVASFLLTPRPALLPAMLLLAALGGVAVGCRYLARHGFRRIDWCAIRPARTWRSPGPDTSRA